MKSLTTFTSQRKEEGKKTLVTYMTAGLPGWIDAVHTAQDNGADIVEIGLPFSDPIMDGPVIAHASALALNSGAKTPQLLDDIANAKFAEPVAIMTYTNILFSHGVKEIISPLQNANIVGLILPDLTFEQSHLFSDVLIDTDISLIQLVSSTTDIERRKQILQATQGFLYCVAIKGITGQNVDLTATYTDFVAPIRQQCKVPTFCGVGVRTPEDAYNLGQLSDGVIVGTSLVEKMIDRPKGFKEVGKMVKIIREALDG